jgi:hypothetical protein
LSDTAHFVAKSASQYIQNGFSSFPLTLCRILAEVGLCKAVLLLTDDSALLKVNEPLLELILLDRELDSYIIMDPVLLAEASQQM